MTTNQRSAQSLQLSHIPNRRRNRSSCALTTSRSVTQLTDNERCADSDRYELNQNQSYILMMEVLVASQVIPGQLAE